MIITKELVREAIELTRPSAVAILNQEGTTWGPKWVAGVVSAPDLEDLIYFNFGEVPISIGKRPLSNWKAEWESPEYFYEVAGKKLRLIMRERASSSVIVATRPWCLNEGEFLYAGGSYDSGIGSAASGAKGRADEGISGILVVNIKMLAHLETDRRILENQMQI